MWFILALLSALFSSLANVARRTHGSLAQPSELSWWSLLLSLPLGVGLVAAAERPLWTSLDFVVPTLVVAGINTVGGVLLFRAYKYADVSVVSPLANLLPLGVVITSLVILGTFPAPLGLAGIVLVVGGVYYSSVNGKHDLVHPIRVMLKSRGSRAMLGWIGLMSVSSVFSVIALQSASAAFLLLFIQLTEFLLLSLYLLVRPPAHRIKHGEKIFRRWGWHLAAISVFTTIAVYFQLTAMAMVDVSYVLSVKRLDVIFTILLAGYFLKERHIMRRLKGSIVALAGVVIILLVA